MRRTLVFVHPFHKIIIAFGHQFGQADRSDAQ